jgi:DNA-binding HxlR family transcriptional regulator
MEGSKCPAQHALQLLQEKWILQIISILLQGPHGFNELSRDVGGCNPTTLAQRLERLERAGLVTKTVRSTMPPRTSYELTEGGKALESVINAIHEWAARYLHEEEARNISEREEAEAPSR